MFATISDVSARSSRTNANCVASGEKEIGPLTSLIIFSGVPPRADLEKQAKPVRFAPNEVNRISTGRKKQAAVLVRLQWDEFAYPDSSACPTPLPVAFIECVGDRRGVGRDCGIGNQRA